MFVQVRWENRSLAVPLMQLDVQGLRGVSPATRTAVADWDYWVDQGYEF